MNVCCLSIYMCARVCVVSRYVHVYSCVCDLGVYMCACAYMVSICVHVCSCMCGV